MTTSDDASRTYFLDLEQTGRLLPLLNWITEQSRITERDLSLLIRKVLITDAQALAEVHAYQGRLSAYADLLVKMKALGQRPAPALQRQDALAPPSKVNGQEPEL
jgi:hypothetical protein